jgi:hypothetical protein
MPKQAWQAIRIILLQDTAQTKAANLPREDIEHARLPDGPGSLLEVMAWPRHIVSLLSADLLKQRCEHLCEGDFIVATDYSGKQSPEFTMMYLEAA